MCARSFNVGKRGWTDPVALTDEVARAVKKQPNLPVDTEVFRIKNVVSLIHRREGVVAGKVTLRLSEGFLVMSRADTFRIDGRFRFVETEQAVAASSEAVRYLNNVIGTWKGEQ